MLAVCGRVVRGEVLRLRGLPHVSDVLRCAAGKAVPLLQGSYTGLCDLIFFLIPAASRVPYHVRIDSTVPNRNQSKMLIYHLE